MIHAGTSGTGQPLNHRTNKMDEYFIYGAATVFIIVAGLCSWKLGREFADLKLTIRWRLEEAEDWIREGNERPQ